MSHRKKETYGFVYLKKKNLFSLAPRWNQSSVKSKGKKRSLKKKCLRVHQDMIHEYRVSSSSSSFLFTEEACEKKMYCKKKEMIYLSPWVRVKRAEQSRARGSKPSDPELQFAFTLWRFIWLPYWAVCHANDTLPACRDVSRYEWHLYNRVNATFALYFVTEKMLNVMFIFTTISF